MNKLLSFIILTFGITLVLFFLLALCYYGVNILSEHPFKGLFFICLGASIVPTFLGVSR